ncbi:glycosyltransferase family 2 protein [Ephemerocybe angulata]|uniref:chitin synthase n=1 Tax=Ephemerocybe angulata TaxID=980116 RepID=A0A8H6LT12_9AGAR|nr:glycosyltransferase family 2 protein [Tulosesus angulatus]
MSLNSSSLHHHIPRDKLDSVTDLSSLPFQSLNDDTVVSVLRERFMTDNIYTALSSSALVALNPHKYVQSNSDAVCKRYADEYRDVDGGLRSGPHVFQLAGNAYYHMRRTGQDQCIVFTGETASGKSESRRLATKMLLTLSTPPPGKKNNKLAASIPAAEFVLESFGHARTLFNPNASRYGKYTELQFTAKGRICGVKVLDYYLERGRVASIPSGERNFHVFYYLVAGVSPEEGAHLRLGEKSVFRYLGGQRGSASLAHPGATGGPGGGDEDSNKFDQLKVALKTIGFSKRHVAQTCQVLAAILHLGNLEFVIDRHRNEDAAVVRNTDVLGVVADFLGISPSALEGALSYKTKLVKKELCTVFLDVDGASDNRDDLAKTLYSLLFNWINEYINQRLCAKDDGGAFETYVGLLDLAGPQNMSSRPNSLDQFVVNYANERVWGWVRERLIGVEVVKEHVSEGIESYVPAFAGLGWNDNSETLRLMHNYPGGLIHIMDDQARRQPKKTDGTMVEAFQKRWGNHTSFKTSGVVDSSVPGAPATNVGLGASFTISHFNGPVTYLAENFLSRDLDSVNGDFVSLLRGTADPSSVHHHTAARLDPAMAAAEGYGSINPFVKGLFSGGAVKTEAYARNEDTIVSAQQSVGPMRMPSVRRKGTVRRGAREEREKMEGIGEEGEEDGEGPFKKDTACVAGAFKGALDTLFETLDETQAWYVFCINPNDSQLPNQLEGRSVKGQVKASGLVGVARRGVGGGVWEVRMTYAEFGGRYRDVVGGSPTSGHFGEVDIGDEKAFVVQAREALGLGAVDVVMGRTKVWLSQRAFHAFEDRLRALEGETTAGNAAVGGEEDGGIGRRGIMCLVGGPHTPGYEGGLTPGMMNMDNGSQGQLMANASPFAKGGGPYDEEYGGGRSEEYDGSRGGPFRGGAETESVSNFGSESVYAPDRNMFQNTDKRGLSYGKDKEASALAGELAAGGADGGPPVLGETAEVLKESSARRRWVVFTWFLTWWIPTPLLQYVGRMKRMDVRQAWREKLALNLIIWLICLITVFVIAVLGVLICPTEHVFNTSELAGHTTVNDPANVFVAIRGEVFDLGEVAQQHLRTVPVVAQKAILKYGGTIADDLFPVQVSALCAGIDGNVSPYVTLNSKNNTDPNAAYHDFRAFTTDPRPDWYFEKMVQMRYTARKGFVGFTPKEIRNMAGNGRSVGVYNGLVYDVTSYLTSPPATASPEGTMAPSGTNTKFLDESVLELFKLKAGQDLTKALNGLNINNDLLGRQKICLRNLYTIGKVDNRNSAQCLFATYILLVLSIVMVSIIGFKFLASINFGASRAPEDHDKFVICQVPCYTEGDTSLRRTIDSLAQMKYDDKRKLLLIICDGMIVGSGNDRPTPRIVLDILGADPNLDPEPLSFVSLGEGAKQHNMGKVYSGLYECSGHVVPYLVVAKVGKPTERSRPGNRGKRDSQMLLMHFLNKVHFNSPMNPLELEMYHQIKNVIGVNPSFYEYLFMVDADTTVEPLSVNRLISAMIHDKKLLGVCGETELANAKQSLITMMQVYEYFISHHMAKAFESLFGSVTCLPGCFTLYRLRTPDTHKPLLISNQLIHDYQENRVDTLHMKNLLHLGEDRYLTTLLLKHFPTFKTQFVRDAHAYTVAPDDWKVLLSQRRRWINSTVHNLGELIFLDQLCGFCCFSMRFVVMIDLLSTITQPVTIAYIVYLIYLVAGEGKTIPTLSLIMIAAIYGVQALVFIMRRKWDMIGWMIFYILAIPMFSFFLPLYSFWRMDDFSWGQTRMVMGESGKKLIVHDEGKFDPKAIPLKSWSDYENELWDKESNHSIGSWVPPTKKEAGYAESRTASLYGRETYYDPTPQIPRSFSPAPSQLGMGVYTNPYGGAAGYQPPPGYQSGRNTPQGSFSRPMSPAVYQPTPSRPTTNYLDMPMEFGGGLAGGNSSPLGQGGAVGGQPSDAELERAVQDILRSADLNTITKREVRRTLEEQFGMDLTGRKGMINGVIDRVLMSQ